MGEIMKDVKYQNTIKDQTYTVLVPLKQKKKKKV